MKYHELQVNKNTQPRRKGRGISAGQGKPLVAALRVKNLAPAISGCQVSWVVSAPYASRT